MAQITRRNDNAFLSVFAKQEHSIPTPKATPVIGVLSSSDQSFGGFASHGQVQYRDDQPLQYQRAWSTATRYLALPSIERAATQNHDEVHEVRSAIEYLFADTSHRLELVEWYRQEIHTHFNKLILPKLSYLSADVPDNKIERLLHNTISILESAHDTYICTVKPPRKGRCVLPGTFITRIEQSIHTLVLNSLSHAVLETILTRYLYISLVTSLQRTEDPARCLDGDYCLCAPKLDVVLLRRLGKVGISGELAERVFAQALNHFISGPGVIRRCFAVQWTEGQTVIPRVRAWVRSCLKPEIDAGLLAILSAGGDRHEDRCSEAQLTLIAIMSIGWQRVCLLYEYVRRWPESTGALLDIKEYLNCGDISTKARLCDKFSYQIQQRLLHAGVSTNEILEVYISVIHAMKLLDPRGVLLEKVAIPIRNYLRSREDTAVVMAKSFLAKLDSNGELSSEQEDRAMICAEIAQELANCTLDAREMRVLNWSDMEWIPDPIDAGPEYKSSKLDDVIAHIFGLFDHDDLISSVQAALGDHFRHTMDSELVNETKLIELLKSRLDVSKLQSIEVMLKDVRESVQLNKRANPAQHKSSLLSEPDPKEIQAAMPPGGITLPELYNKFKERMPLSKFTAAVRLVANKRNDVYFAKRSRLPGLSETVSAASEEGVRFDAKVLSEYFWPQDLQAGEIKIDLPVIDAYKRTYSELFANSSGQRKLDWAAAYDTVDIELELEDRTLQFNGVLAWRWNILTAFSAEGANGTSNNELTATEVADMLSIDEDMVLEAIAYWVSKDVLFQKSAGVYTVLERKDMDIDHADELEAQEDLLQINMDDVQFRKAVPMIEMFIQNMLKAGGGRSVSGPTGITMMLQMMMPGFSYGDDEIVLVLDEMRSRGETAVEGELWRMA